MAALVACGGTGDGAQHPSTAPTGAPGAASQDGAAPAAAQQPPASPAASAHWVLEAPGIRGDFQSPVRGDIWAGAYHRVNGTWIRPFDVTGDRIWVASPTQVWALQTRTGQFQVSTPSGQSVTDLSKPGRVFTAVGDGWIAFADSSSTSLNGSVGLMRPRGAGFDEIPLTGARGTATDVYESAALTEYGEVFFWNGSVWERNGSVSHPAGPTSMYSWTRLSGSGRGDLFAAAWLHASQLAGSGWNDFSLPHHVPQSIWARPYGPRWVVGGGAAAAEIFEWDGYAWQDRGEAPGNWNVGGPPVVGSDGIDVFVADHDGIYRYVP